MRKFLISLLLGGFLWVSASAQIAESILSWDGDKNKLNDLPQLLSGSGFDPSNSTVFVQYDVNVPQYRDLMKSTRYVSVPAGLSIIPGDSINYVFPVGTALIRVIEIDTVLDDPTTTKKVEVQMQIRNTGATWSRLVYMYNDDGSDANLLNPADPVYSWKMGSFPIVYGTEAAKYTDNSTLPPTTSTGATISYVRFSGDCASCHYSTSANGFITQQLNKGNQLQELYDKGILFSVPDIAAIEAKGMISKWYSMDDPVATLEQKVRSYLAGNCSQCHNHIPERHVSGQSSSYEYFHDERPEFWYSQPPAFKFAKPDSSPVLLRMATPDMPNSEVRLRDVRALNMLREWSVAYPLNVRNPGPGNLGKSFQASLKNQKLYISNVSGPTVNVSMYTWDGKEVKLHKLSDGSHAVLDKLTNGVYLVRVNEKSAPVQYFSY